MMAVSGPDWLLSASNDEWAKMMEDGARKNNVWHPGIYHSYADIDREALALAVVELSTVDVEADLPDIQMPILLLVGTNDDMHYTGASRMFENSQ